MTIIYETETSIIIYENIHKKVSHPVFKLPTKYFISKLHTKIFVGNLPTIVFIDRLSTNFFVGNYKKTNFCK